MTRTFDITIAIPLLLGTIFGAAIMHLITADQRAHFGGAAVGTLVGLVVGMVFFRKEG